jgi:hypothetical protein
VRLEIMFGRLKNKRNMVTRYDRFHYYPHTSVSRHLLTMCPDPKHFDSFIILGTIGLLVFWFNGDRSGIWKKFKNDFLVQTSVLSFLNV